ncbi:MAG: phage holin family protein [Chitinophagaceae bacterium]
MNFIIKLIISSLVAFALSKILPGIHLQGFTAAVILAVVLAFFNAIIKPILIIFTLPITIFTLGLFLFVINAFIILVADKLLDNFQVDGFWWALLFSVLLSFASSVLYSLGKKE